MSKTIWFLAMVAVASMNEEMTLEEKRIENAMFAMVGEKPPHDDVPVEPHYLNPSDLLLTSINKAKEQREKHRLEDVTKAPALPMEATTRAFESPMVEQNFQKPDKPSIQMRLHGGFQEVILFDFWKVNSRQGLVISFMVIFLMGGIYEGLRKLQVYLRTLKGRKRKESFQLPTVVTVTDGRALKEDFKDLNSPLVANSESATSETEKAGLFSFVRIARGFVYTVQLTLACTLMLIVMTYNIWLVLAVVLGAGFGHWIFE